MKVKRMILIVVKEPIIDKISQLFINSKYFFFFNSTLSKLKCIDPSETKIILYFKTRKLIILNCTIDLFSRL